MAEDGPMTDQDRLQILRYNIGRIDEDEWNMFKSSFAVGPKFEEVRKIELYFKEHGHLLPQNERSRAAGILSSWKRAVRLYGEKNPPTIETHGERLSLR